MKKLFSQIFQNTDTRTLEQALIIILPLVSLIAAALIVSPRLISYIRYTKTLPPPSAPEIASPIPADNAAVSTPVPTPAISPGIFRAPDGSGWRVSNGKSRYYDSRGNMLTGLKYADGRICYFGQDGAKAEKLGIDISRYNKSIDWYSVKRSGIDFAILRAGGRGWTSGLIYDDECFRQNLDCTRLVGMDIGVYFYSTAINPSEAVDEANYVLTQLHGRKLTMPIYIDVEQSGEYPYGRADRLPKSRRAQIINAFCNTVERAGYEAGVYSGQSFFKYHVDYPSLKRYDTWLASYTKYNRLPNFNDRYDMWQFTDSGMVQGIRGIVDMNVIF